MPDLGQILEARHETYLEWCEPYPGCGPDGNEITATVHHRATVHDCINMQRKASWPATCDDKNHLLDFIANNHAKILL